MTLRCASALLALLLGLPAAAADRLEALAGQVRATEAAFAATLAARDLEAFTRFLAPDAVFVDDPVQRGPAAIVAAWRRYFEGAKAPFSWAPETVAVLDSGRLALSSGPVLAPDGRRIGTFNSVWRREHDGQWRIVLDHGCPACRCPPPASKPAGDTGAGATGDATDSTGGAP